MISRSLRIVGLLRLVPTRDGVVRAPCRYPCLLQVEDDPAVDTPLAHAFEDGVDVLQPARMDMGVNLALRREVERFFQVLPRADDRAAHGDAFENDLEDGDWEVRPFKQSTPLRRSMRSACENAVGETAVTSAPCAPLIVF